MADRKSSDLERNVAGPSPSKQSKGKKSVVLQELIQETKEKNASMISVDAMRDLLDDQMEEMHGLFVAHFQKNKRMLDKLEQDQKVKEFELNTLRNQLMTLGSMGSPSKQVGRGAGLDRAQLETAKKLLVQRDAACRLAEQENFQLREQLAAMQAAGNHSMLKKSADGVFAPDPVSPLPPSTADSVLHRIERAQTVLQTWASNHHPRIKLAEYVDSDDEDMDLPGAVPTNRKGETKALPDEKEDEEEEPIDPKAEYLRQNQKQRKKKALNSKLKALDMKSRMRDAFAEPSYIATEHYHKTGWAQYIAKSYWFEHGTMLVILLNSVWLGIDSTINSRALLFDAGPGIIFVENLLCLIFSVEIIIRFVAFKSKLQAFKDFWFVFDFLLAFLMVLETWVIAVVLMVTGEDLFLIDTSVLGRVFFRMLRLLRLTRVARIARLLRFLPEVMILVRAIGAATRSVILTVLLGLMIVYVFAIAFTQVAVDTPAGHAYFSSLPQAMFSLIFNGCFNNNLVEMARLSFQDDLVVSFLFAGFLLIAPLTVMNLLLGVLVEVVRVVATAEQEGRVVRNLKEELHYAKEAMGADDTTISQEEFISLLQNDQAIDVLQDVGVDLIALVKDPNIIFEGEPFMGFQDFLDEILLLRGSNTATVKDLTVLKNQIIQTLPQVLKKKLRV